MRRSLACASAVLLLAACGDSSSSPSPAEPAQPSLHGTVGGQAFVPADAAAVALGAATCSFEGTNASATGLALGFGSFTGLCNVVTQTRGCGSKANATVVNLLLVRANVLGGTATAVPPGTYGVSASIPAPDSSGHITVAQAFITRTDATCGEVNPPIAISGTIRIAAVGARVTGSADLTFDDGSRVSGSFDVPTCGFSTDVCSAISGCTTSTCVP